MRRSRTTTRNNSRSESDLSFDKKQARIRESGFGPVVFLSVFSASASEHAACGGYSVDRGGNNSAGEACAFTLDAFVRINADARLEELCRRAGLSGTEELAAWIAGIKQRAGLKTRLSELGEAEIPALAKAAAAHPLMKNNPVPMDEAALEKMFEGLK